MSDPNSNSATRGAREPDRSASDPQPQEPPFPSEPEPTPPTPAEPNPVTPQEPQPETPSPNEPSPSEPYPGAPQPDAPGAPQPAPGAPEPSPSSPEPDAPGPFDPGTPAASAAGSRSGSNGAHAHGAEADARRNDPALSDTRDAPSDAETAKHDTHPFTEAYDGAESSDDHRLTPSEPAAETVAVSRDSGDEAQTERLARAEAARADADRSDTGPAYRDADDSRYVQAAPPEPKRRGNRGFGILIGVLQAIIFAALFYGALLLVRLLTGEDLNLVGLLTSPMFLITVCMFFIGLVIVSLLVNRAGWWAWILLGLLVAAFAYVGAVGGSLVQDAMSVPSNRVREYLVDTLLTWPSVIAFVLGREVPIWFGAWVAARGRRVTQRNIEAHDEYERKLDERAVGARR